MNILEQAKEAASLYPARITELQFLAMIEENPSVFKDWETPLEITEYVDGYRSPITHLSKHLTFSGRNKNGESASFLRCEHLKVATGTFHGLASFSASGVERIEELNILKPDTGQWCATFCECKHLKVATGHYPYPVNFSGSEIESIRNLHIEKPDHAGNYGDFSNCTKLLTLEGWDTSKKIWNEPHRIEAEIKRRNSLKEFVKKIEVETLPFL
jgi:hypothetical protein